MVWKGLERLWESGKLRPTVFERKYQGLESAVQAMKDLEARKVWGKAVVLLGGEKHTANL